MKKLTLIIFILLFFACDDDDQKIEKDPYSEYHKISGIVLTDVSGRTLGTLGEYTSPNRFSVYPNPASSNFVIYFELEEISDIKLWLEPAVYIGEEQTLDNGSFRFIDSISTLYKPVFPANEILNEIEIKSIQKGQNSINIQSIFLPNDSLTRAYGFYKLFLEINDSTFIENIWFAERE